MARYELSAQIREKTGKEAAKKIRKSNRVPSVFYGPETDPIKLTVDNSQLKKILKKTAGDNIILGLQIESEQGIDSRLVMLKELQSDPIKDRFLHVDFMEVSLDKEITLDIPVRLVNTPRGVSDNGGILQHVRREIAISCLPNKLVDFIEVDVAGLDIGETLHIEDIKFPEGMKSVQEGNLTVATVMAPTVKEIEEEAETVEETEVERSKPGAEATKAEE
ncbi:MAG: 50S ribosomal protein L25 [Deltaproteobacteria bacterium]|nr:50S ribosomal protein L25 [Deltaproteobacteria bacterium]